MARLPTSDDSNLSVMLASAVKRNGTISSSSDWRWMALLRSRFARCASLQHVGGLVALTAFVYGDGHRVQNPDVWRTHYGLSVNDGRYSLPLAASNF